MSPHPVIVWFRNDLRLRDHPALSAAVKSGAPVVPLFILDDDLAGHWKLGSASRWWLANSLEALGHEIAQRGGNLVLRRGDTTRELVRVVEECRAGAVYFTRDYEPFSVAIEKRMNEVFAAKGVAFKRYGGRLLREPEELRTASDKNYRVFTPFWHAFLRDFALPKELPAPASIAAPSQEIASDKLSAWKLLPTKPDWSAGLKETWQPGEAGARARLKDFVDDALSGYSRGRDRLDHVGTSRLSPHLTFGEISPAACWRAASHAANHEIASDQSVEIFQNEMVWREFCHSLLFHFPTMPESPLRAEFASFPWARSSAHLKAWQKGLTGYPIVDAGMRELWTTGFMHNRARMIVASFLTKHLLLPWTAGEAWFWDTLVDADLANNAANWQWVAGCGADAAPYFRIFNPVLQGEKFDPDGDYVRRWVPELARLRSREIHAPWTADADMLSNAGIIIGKTYPAPIIDHKAARAGALNAYEKIKNSVR